MTGTSTGRLASTDPNLQNIPVRTEEGRRIREALLKERQELGRELFYLSMSRVETKADWERYKAREAEIMEKLRTTHLALTEGTTE